MSSLEEYRRENLSLRADFEALKSTQNKTRKSDIVPKLEGVINNLEKKVKKSLGEYFILTFHLKES